MAVTEKRIHNIEKTLNRQDEQIARLFSDVSAIKTMFAQVKGMFIGGIGIIVLLQVGLLDALKVFM
tara:strand:+ start:278 stop:475 length:198 start_codon:yes stop_codon:yes gene_type:complete